jgi:hypothetical protein
MLIQNSQQSSGPKRPMVDWSNPLDNPNSSLNSEQADATPDIYEIAEDISEEVAEDMAEEMMAEQLAQEEADEEADEDEDEKKGRPEEKDPGTPLPQGKPKRSQETDENADWRPVAQYHGQEWNLA